jgi:hypothetical protein
VKATFGTPGVLNVAFRTSGRAGNDRTPPREGDGARVGRFAQADGVSSTSRLRVRFGSTGMPGPVVVETVTFFR